MFETEENVLHATTGYIERVGRYNNRVAKQVPVLISSAIQLIMNY